jgi:DEAD/DEAH box helicase domain-containing protein
MARGELRGSEEPPQRGRREIEPWTELLDGARGGEQLVGEAFEHARAARFVAAGGAAPATRSRRCAQAASRSSTSISSRRSRLPGAEPVITTTGTASGKSLCFNLPTLDVLLRDAKARALYLYPTKALAQDQARAIARFGLGDRVATGDLRRRHAARGPRARSAAARI